MTTDEIIAIVAELSEYIPIIEQTVPTILEAGSKLQPIVTALNNAIVDNTMAAIKRYEVGGFSREEAILLTINTKAGLVKAMNNTKK